MRRDWARRLLDADKAQGLLLPVRLYAFEDASSRTVVSYFRPWSALESVDNESLRNLARQMDAVIGEIVRESTSKIP